MEQITPPTARTLPLSPSPRSWHSRFDLLGATVSLACTVHCIALPLLVAFVPAAMMALRSFQHPAHGLMTALLTLSRWEWAFAVLASTLALSSTAAGWHRHRHGLPVLLAILGAVLLSASALYLPLKESIVWHSVCTILGGSLLAAAHLVNRHALGKARGVDFVTGVSP